MRMTLDDLPPAMRKQAAAKMAPASKPTPAKRKVSQGERNLYLQLTVVDVPMPELEYRFHPTRKWRFDFAWPDHKFAVEVEGLLYGEGGRHQRSAGFEGDLEKYHNAMDLGWTVYRCSSALIQSGKAVALIEKLLKEKEKARHKNHKARNQG